MKRNSHTWTHNNLMLDPTATDGNGGGTTIVAPQPESVPSIGSPSPTSAPAEAAPTVPSGGKPSEKLSIGDWGGIDDEFGVKFPDAKPADAAKKTEEVKAPVGKDTTVPKAQTDTVQTQDTTQQQNQRDYSIFDEADREILKKAPNFIFDYFKEHVAPLRKLNKELGDKLAAAGSNVLPVSYHENPNAYMLSPTWQQGVQTAQQHEFEENHWEQQLAALEAGNSSYTDIKGYDQQGNPVMEKVELTAETLPRAKIQLQKWLNTTSSVRQAHIGEMQKIAANHKNTHSEVISNVKAITEKFFKPYTDPKHPRAAVMAQAKQGLHPALQQSPLADIIAYNYGMTLDLIAALEAKDKEIATLKGIKNDRVAAGPTSGEVQRGVAPTNVNGSGKLSMKDWQ